VPGFLGLRAGKTRRMSADAAGAADHDQRREQQRRQFQGTVTEFTRVQSVHVAATYVRSSVQRSKSALFGGVIELIGLKIATSSESQAHCVNTLTEELGHIRFLCI